VSENLDRRVLAGFRCIDAITSRSVLQPLSVTAPQLALRRNHSGIFAVVDAPGFTGLTKQFLAPSAWPAPATFEITIQDPALQYLPRRANIAAPQPLPVAPPPAVTTTAGPTTTTSAPVTTTTGAPTTTLPAGPPPIPTLNTPQDVVLYPTTAAAMAPNWAVVRVSVSSTAVPAAPLPWAVVKVTGPGNPPAAGVTNANGEALLAVPGLGLKLSSSGTGSVTETTTPATVTAWFDPASLTQPKGWIPNPDDILLNLGAAQWKSASQAVQLGPGQTVFVNLRISL
jgi:hypothetical protein